MFQGYVYVGFFHVFNKIDSVCIEYREMKYHSNFEGNISIMRTTLHKIIIKPINVFHHTSAFICIPLGW